MKKDTKQPTDYTAMPYDALLGVVISGCKFKYASYDFKAAYKELQNTKPEMFIDLEGIEHRRMAELYMPEELKEKHRVWRIGKLRRLHFNPSGRAWKFEIGAKRAKTFYASDFGVNVIPLT
jgi:hypothetical protein